MIVGSDAKLCRVFAAFQTCPQDAVVHHIEERTNAVPALVVEPDLERERRRHLVSVTSGDIQCRLGVN